MTLTNDSYKWVMGKYQELLEKEKTWTKILRQYLFQPIVDPVKQIVENTYSNLQQHKRMNNTLS